LGSIRDLITDLRDAGESVSGKTVTVSGSGNVALYGIEKLTQLGAKVVTASDSSGYIYDKDGINAEKLEWLKDTADAVAILQKDQVMFAPAKAANAGGVAVSGLEQSQNALRIAWSAEEVDQKLKSIMKDIHSQCLIHSVTGTGDTVPNYLAGANRAGFIKVFLGEHLRR